MFHVMGYKFGVCETIETIATDNEHRGTCPEGQSWTIFVLYFTCCKVFFLGKKPKENLSMRQQTRFS